LAETFLILLRLSFEPFVQLFFVVPNQFADLDEWRLVGGLVRPPAHNCRLAQLKLLGDFLGRKKLCLFVSVGRFLFDWCDNLLFLVARSVVLRAGILSSNLILASVKSYDASFMLPSKDM
jgi:hypothetical protein